MERGVTKSEVKRLLDELRIAHLEKDEIEIRNVLKKIVADMTVGVDVSLLFGEVVKVI